MGPHGRMGGCRDGMACVQRTLLVSKGSNDLSSRPSLVRIACRHGALVCAPHFL